MKIIRAQFHKTAKRNKMSYAKQNQANQNKVIPNNRSNVQLVNGILLVLAKHGIFEQYLFFGNSAQVNCFQFCCQTGNLDEWDTSHKLNTRRVIFMVTFIWVAYFLLSLRKDSVLVSF